MLIPSGEEAKKKKGGESKRWPHKRIGLVGNDGLEDEEER